MFKFTSLLDFIVDMFVKAIAFVVYFLTPISSFIHIVLILLAIDNISGIWASLKEGEKFTAKKLRMTVTKFVWYALAIITGYLLQKLFNEGTQIARVVAIYLAAVETKSIYENIARITDMDVFKDILIYIQNLIKTRLNDNTGTTSGNDANSPMGVD